MKRIIRHSAAEDVAITKAAMDDPDSIPFTDEEWEKAKPSLVRGRESSPNRKANGSATLKKAASKLK
ncbi:hypothetical protein ICN42_11660 [Polynucleobacter sp. 71A-WALBACH]|uniref:hypothetical protein n=1 Tax=Polynucleobacter sp. 71A-WALBACH TaxID=2689097 RepID=UPI001C0B3059|nr:hypothetical protein [Polynucleobacter sp. 71A-WALBACH]MBU3594747.1 hypothetical protein [Polynucleobacter sp. 71A-WALBACH]